MSWDATTKWAWRASRVTRRDYPSHGVEVEGGRLTGSTSTDYFHFDCPKCGPGGHGLDVELLGVRDDSGPGHPNARTIMLGLACRECGLRDLTKIGCLENEEYQPRRPAKAR